MFTGHKILKVFLFFLQAQLNRQPRYRPLRELRPQVSSESRPWTSEDSSSGSDRAVSRESRGTAGADREIQVMFGRWGEQEIEGAEIFKDPISSKIIYSRRVELTFSQTNVWDLMFISMNYNHLIFHVCCYTIPVGTDQFASVYSILYITYYFIILYEFVNCKDTKCHATFFEKRNWIPFPVST